MLSGGFSANDRRCEYVDEIPLLLRPRIEQDDEMHCVLKNTKRNVCGLEQRSRLFDRSDCLQTYFHRKLCSRLCWLYQKTFGS